mgnify:FL=1
MRLILMKTDWFRKTAKASFCAFFTVLVISYWCNFEVRANSAEILQNRFANHTIIYIDRATGQSHSIYLGKLGNYDEYFPCEFTDGNWWLAKNGQICLLDLIDNSRRNGSSCLKPKFNGNVLSFKDDEGNLAYHAKLVKGYALPFG